MRGWCSGCPWDTDGSTCSAVTGRRWEVGCEAGMELERGRDANPPPPPYPLYFSSLYFNACQLQTHAWTNPWHILCFVHLIVQVLAILHPGARRQLGQRLLAGILPDLGDRVDKELPPHLAEGLTQADGDCVREQEKASTRSSCTLGLRTWASTPSICTRGCQTLAARLSIRRWHDCNNWHYEAVTPRGHRRTAKKIISSPSWVRVQGSDGGGGGGSRV